MDYFKKTTHAEWPDLAKFRHFGIILKVFGNFSKVNLVFGKIWGLFWPILYAIEQISLLNNTLDI